MIESDCYYWLAGKYAEISLLHYSETKHFIGSHTYNRNKHIHCIRNTGIGPEKFLWIFEKNHEFSRNLGTFSNYLPWNVCFSSWFRFVPTSAETSESTTMNSVHNSHRNAEFITEEGADIFKCVSKIGCRYATVVPKLQNNKHHLISMPAQNNQKDCLSYTNVHDPYMKSSQWLSRLQRCSTPDYVLDKILVG